MYTALVGLVVGLSIVSAFGIWSARISRSKGDTKHSPIGFSRPATSHDSADLNKSDPEGMKLAGGGSAKNQFPGPSSGR